MSRPKVEKKTTSAERMRKWRQSKKNKESELKQKKENYHRKRKTVSPEQLEEQQSQANSRERLAETLNRQKI